MSETPRHYSTEEVIAMSKQTEEEGHMTPIQAELSQEAEQKHPARARYEELHPNENWRTVGYIQLKDGGRKFVLFASGMHPIEGHTPAGSFYGRFGETYIGLDSDTEGAQLAEKLYHQYAEELKKGEAALQDDDGKQAAANQELSDYEKNRQIEVTKDFARGLLK